MINQPNINNSSPVNIAFDYLKKLDPSITCCSSNIENKISQIVAQSSSKPNPTILPSTSAGEKRSMLSVDASADNDAKVQQTNHTAPRFLVNWEKTSTPEEALKSWLGGNTEELQNLISCYDQRVYLTPFITIPGLVDDQNEFIQLSIHPTVAIYRSDHDQNIHVLVGSEIALTHLNKNNTTSVDNATITIPLSFVTFAWRLTEKGLELQNDGTIYGRRDNLPFLKDIFELGLEDTFKKQPGAKEAILATAKKLLDASNLVEKPVNTTNDSSKFFCNTLTTMFDHTTSDSEKTRLAQLIIEDQKAKNIFSFNVIACFIAWYMAFNDSSTPDQKNNLVTYFDSIEDGERADLLVEALNKIPLDNLKPNVLLPLLEKIKASDYKKLLEVSALIENLTKDQTLTGEQKEQLAIIILFQKIAEKIASNNDADTKTALENFAADILKKNTAISEKNNLIEIAGAINDDSKKPSLAAITYLDNQLNELFDAVDSIFKNRKLKFIEKDPDGKHTLQLIKTMGLDNSIKLTPEYAFEILSTIISRAKELKKSKGFTKAMHQLVLNNTNTVPGFKYIDYKKFSKMKASNIDTKTFNLLSYDKEKADLSTKLAHYLLDTKNPAWLNQKDFLGSTFTETEEKNKVVFSAIAKAYDQYDSISASKKNKALFLKKIKPLLDEIMPKRAPNEIINFLGTITDDQTDKQKTLSLILRLTRKEKYWEQFFSTRAPLFKKNPYKKTREAMSLEDVTHFIKLDEAKEYALPLSKLLIKNKLFKKNSPTVAQINGIFSSLIRPKQNASGQNPPTKNSTKAICLLISKYPKCWPLYESPKQNEPTETKETSPDLAYLDTALATAKKQKNVSEIIEKNPKYTALILAAIFLPTSVLPLLVAFLALYIKDKAVARKKVTPRALVS
jgi:hypothetical protein